MVVMARVPVGERRALLVAAAHRVLLRDGLGAATTRAICAEADMPQGTFHYCFGSRDELLAEVAGSLVPAEMSAATAAIDGRARSPTSSIARCWATGTSPKPTRTLSG